MAVRQITIEQLDQCVGRLTAVFPGDQTKALEECDGLLLAGIEENFDNSQSATGEVWPARKPDPNEKRPGHSLLILEGDLMAAATGKSGIPADISEDQLVQYMPKGQTGTSLAGIRRHEFGDQVILGKEGILPRPYYGISKETADKCTDVVADGVVETLLAEL